MHYQDRYCLIHQDQSDPDNLFRILRNVNRSVIIDPGQHQYIMFGIADSQCRLIRMLIGDIHNKEIIRFT